MNRNNKNRRRGRNRSENQLSLVGPRGINGLINCPSQPPKMISNLVIRKTFRFVLSTSVTSEQQFTFTPAKIGALMGYATNSTTIIQLFESVRIRKITVWSSVNNQTTANIAPRTVAVVFFGNALGIMGSNQSAQDMSVGQTRVAKVALRPAPGSQASQWQSTLTSSLPAFFGITAAGGSVCDIDLEATITPDSRAGNASVTVTGAAVVGQLYYLALDNNAGGTGSVSNQWVPPPDLITIT